MIENLVDEANVVRAVANATHGRSRFIDLNKASTDYVNAIGQIVCVNLTPSLVLVLCLRECGCGYRMS